jgi:hypothetical protein
MEVPTMGPPPLQSYVAANGAQPGMATSVAALFDAARGTYESKPMPEYPFCSGQSHLT